MKRVVVTLAGIILILSLTTAQKGIQDSSKYGHGEDSIRCLTNLSLYTEYYKQKNYKDAFPYWEIVFNECPLSTPTIYTNGATILRSFIDAEVNTQQKENDYLYLMKVYDTRIKYFGNNNKYPTAYIQGLKALDMLRYKREDVTVCKEAYLLLTQSIAEFGNKTQPAVLVTHMTNSIALLKKQNLTAEQVVNVYLSVSEVLYDKLANITVEADDLATLNEAKETVEKLFVSCGAADCETINRIFSPQFPQHSTDVAWLKRISTLLSKESCDNSFVYQVSQSLNQLEPTAISAKSMAVMCLKKKDINKAIDYYKEAINLEQNAEKKGLLNYELGLIFSSMDNYNQARQQFLHAIDLRPNWGAPYIQIGIMYASTAQNCGSDDFEKKGVYWAAVDKFLKAKSIDTTMADEANKQIYQITLHFPTKEEIFFQGLQEGSAYTVGCWINESTTVRAKK